MEAARNALEQWTNPTEPQEQEPVGVRETSESSSGAGKLMQSDWSVRSSNSGPCKIADVRYFSLAFTRTAATRFLSRAAGSKIRMIG